jgi:hypothetical protein
VYGRVWSLKEQMRIAIISNIEAAIGLTRDFELLRDYLESLGHSVTGIQYDAPLPDPLPSFDLALFLETVPPNMMKLAPVNWLFANCEWMKSSFRARSALSRLPSTVPKRVCSTVILHFADVRFRFGACGAVRLNP